MPKAQPKLILASGSPQRRALLAAAGYEFAVLVPSDRAECGVCSKETPPEYASRMAWQKALDVLGRAPQRMPDEVAEAIPSSNPERTVDRITADRIPADRIIGDRIPANRTIVACDTVVECTGTILGKPVDGNHARQMLQLLSGRVHHVYSGLCVWPQPDGPPHLSVAATRLRMDRLSDNQIDEYVASGAWEGKAGGFGYQDRVGWLHIEEGSESNVIGLPLELLAELLAKLD